MAGIFIFPSNEGWFALDSIDLTGLSSVTLNIGWQVPPAKGPGFEVRLDAPDGKLLGKGTMAAATKDQKSGIIKVPLEMIKDGNFHSLYFVYKSTEAIGGGVMSLQFNK